MEDFKSLKIYNYIIVALGFVTAVLYSYGHLIDGDVVQNLVKAHAFVTQGEITPYGNVSSSGMSGNVPGVFLTLIAGLPMKLWFSPWAALAMITFLHFLALLMYQNVLKDFVKPVTVTALLVFFWLNPWRASEVFIWNPTYIFFVSLLHMWSAYHLSKKPSFWFSFIHGQSLFLGLQVHPSFIILFFMTMILLWTRALKPHWPGTLFGILFGLGTLIPYFLAGLEDPSIFPQSGGGDGKGFLFFGLVYVYPLLKGFWYWILFGSTIFQTHVFHQTEFSWLGSETFQMMGKYLWTAIKYTMGIGGVLLSFNVNFKFYKRFKAQFNILKYKFKPTDNWVAQYAIIAFIAALMATAMSPTLPIYWHLLYIWPMALIPLMLRLDQLFFDKAKGPLFRKLLAVCAIYFFVVNIFAALDSKKHDINSSFHELYHKQCQETCVKPE